MSAFQHRGVAWLLLVIFVSSFAPSVSFAQQPTATISAASGTVLVSGQAAKVGTVLSAGDTLQTQAGASVVLRLSDGSEIQLGEQTQINIADLAQTATGARASSIKLLAGWLRAMLSAQHQQKGSSFTIETPNAQVGVKFSQPDVEVSYDPAKQETIGIAHTVELIAINLLTNERIVVPVGSSVIIIGLIMKVIAGTTTAAIAAGTKAAEASKAAAGTATGISTGTMIAIGAGALAAAGGVAAIAASSKNEGNAATAESSGDGDESNIDVSGLADCSQAHTNTNSIACNLFRGTGGEFTVRAGRSYWIEMSYGFPIENSEAEARAQQPYISLSVTMNGVSLPMDGGTNVEYCLCGWWEVNSYHCTGILAPGNYTVTGFSSHSIYGDGGSSTFVLVVK